MNQSDIEKLAVRLRRLAELLETRGVKALQTAHTWIDTSGQYRPPGGDATLCVIEAGHAPGTEALWRNTADARHTVCDRHRNQYDTARQLSKITWERIDDGPREPRDKLDKLDPRRHARLTANLGRLDVDCATLTGLILDTCPREPDEPRDDELPDGACENCWTLNRHFEPVSHYARACRYCGDFKGTEGRYPPRAILRKRHAGQRVTTTDVEKALGRAS